MPVVIIFFFGGLAQSVSGVLNDGIAARNHRSILCGHQLDAELQYNEAAA